MVNKKLAFDQINLQSFGGVLEGGLDGLFIKHISGKLKNESIG